MKYSLSTFVYYRYPLVEAIQRIGRLGYDGVEIWGGRPHAFWEDMDAEHCKAVCSALDENGLGVSCFIPAQFRYPTNLASTDPLIRKNSVDYIKRSIDTALNLGAPLVSLCPGYSFYTEARSRGVDALRESLTELCAHAKDTTADLVLEPAHPMETDIVCTIDDALEILADIGGDNIGILPDTGHLFVNKEPFRETLAKVFALNRPFHIQVDDNNGQSDDHLIPGCGRIDFFDFLTALDDFDYRGWLGVEIGWGYTTDPDPAVRESLAYITEIIKKIRETNDSA